MFRLLVSPIIAASYRPIYLFSRVVGMLLQVVRPQTAETDLVFVIPPDQRGWILEGIAREIARDFPGRCAFHYALQGLPRAKSYFFLHYSSLSRAYKLNPRLWRRRAFVWYTHPREDLGIHPGDVLYALNRAEKVFCSCTAYLRLLARQGVEEARLSCVLGGADPGQFEGHPRGGGEVGFCSAYYPRKSPDLMLEIVRRMPHRRFLLLGRNWRQYGRFSELMTLPNFRYIEAKYEDYPDYYRQMDVFVSVAKLEGGPIPLLEAMMDNAVPVASRTGFAPDLIRHGENGFLFDTEAEAAVICALIDRAMEMQTDIRATVLAHSWKNFSREVHAQMGFAKAGAIS